MKKLHCCEDLKNSPKKLAPETFKNESPLGFDGATVYITLTREKGTMIAFCLRSGNSVCWSFWAAACLRQILRSQILPESPRIHFHVQSISSIHPLPHPLCTLHHRTHAPFIHMLKPSGNVSNQPKYSCCLRTSQTQDLHCGSKKNIIYMIYGSATLDSAVIC